MGTSSGFTPPAAAPCYTVRMTRAAALALRTAAGLVENCTVVVTDGPVIGTAGNTSATEVELRPVSPTEFSMNATVNTLFGTSANAWTCVYDIDLGTAGTLLEIRDNQGNVVRSTAADAPTVQTQFPWHLTVSGQVQNNYVEQSTLTGWGAITTTVRGNQISRNSTVALTGNWGIFTDNRIENGTVNLLHSAGGTRTFTGNTVRGGASFQTTAGATGSWTVTDNDFLDGYVLNGAATSTGTITIDGSRFEAHGATGTDCLIDLGGTKSFNNVRSVTSGATQQYTLTGGGTVTLSDSDFLEGRLVRATATTAAVTVQSGARVTGTLTQAATAVTGALTASGGFLGGSVNHNGPGALTLTGLSLLGGTVTLASTATRGLTLTNTTVQSATVAQNRTGGTGTDTVVDTLVTGQATSVTLAGATDPAGAQTVLSSCRVSDGGTVTLTNPAGSGGVVLLSTVVDSGATFTGTGTVQVNTCRFSAGCTFNAGAFTHDHGVVENNLTVTPTANNTNKLASKALNDWV